ncbi:conjugal transfer protein TraF [Isobaculum melis]|uniref:Bacteriocin transport accessory protein, putative n=1 Tax=Isobaculum melis TaxID=142588 RepID=A0A1H9TDD2_9LACT|nr:conjugal transfer protein TraF [Isobaculum melis]SER95255.1 bacteriocin transport accessory protein, putative [Isobaculum melis]
MKKYIFVGVTLLSAVFIFFLVKAQASANIQDVTLEELTPDLPADERSLIYIGRKDCPVCQKFYPELEQMVSAEKINVYAYDTSKDVKKHLEELNQFTGQLGIQTVPAVLVVKNGEVIEIFEDPIDLDEVLSIYQGLE